MTDGPSRACCEVAILIIVRQPVPEGPAFREFATRYLAGWEATPNGVAEAVGPLQSMIVRRAVSCLLDGIGGLL